jgi:hypothetical protein
LPGADEPDDDPLLPDGCGPPGAVVCGGPAECIRVFVQYLYVWLGVIVGLLDDGEEVL